LIRSAEKDEALSVAALPVALYEFCDELDSESCSDWRNCCRISSAELVSDELPVLPVVDELLVEDEPPWPP
jgi:hypothetical protein